MTAIDLDFTYTKKDCVKALQLHYQNRLHIRFDFAIIFVTLAVSYWRLHDVGRDVLGIVSLGISFLFIFIILSAFFILPTVVYRRATQWHAPYHLQFSEEGIAFQTESIDSRLKWEIYRRTLQDEFNYLLYYGENQFTVVPKRLFVNDTEKQAFEALLKAKNLL